jgi:hypothetical protein
VDYLKTVACVVEEVVATKVARNARTTVKINEDVKFGILLVVLFASIVAEFIQPNHVVVAYDCGIAEISPDVPVAVKEQCRRKMEKTKGDSNVRR